MAAAIGTTTGKTWLTVNGQTMARSLDPRVETQEGQTVIRAYAVR